MTPEPADDGVLTPEELQLDDDRVDELGDNRYIVRSGRSDTPSALAAAADAAGDVPAESEGAESAPSTIASGASADAGALAEAPEPHGVEITLKTDGKLAHHRATSNDVREVFADLLTWYASQLDDDLSPIEALQVLLATTDLEG